MKNGPFDGDLVFAPDGIERFEDAWRRGADINGCPVCSIEDIIASKQASNRAKDRETLPRLRSFRDYLREPGREPPRVPRLRLLVQARYARHIRRRGFQSIVRVKEDELSAVHNLSHPRRPCSALFTVRRACRAQSLMKTSRIRKQSQLLKVGY